MEENKRKQYAHLYEHHEVEDPQPREEKEKPIGPSGRNRHRPMVEKVCRRIAFSFLAMAVVLLLALNYFQIKEAKKEAVLEYIRKEKQQMKNRETEKTDQLAILDQYDILYSMYPDLVGWIKVDGTPIDYPVMQTQDDPEFYLHRGFDKEYAASGVPFMDAVSDIFVPTSNFLIYGHNMKNGTMFHDLLEYEDKAFYEQHPTFKFDTIYKGGQGTYQVIAAGYTQIYPQDSKKFKYYQYAGMTTETEFYEYLRGVREISSYDTGVSAEYGDQLITLSTCAYHVEDGRFIVVAKRTDAKQRVPQ